MSSAKLLLEQLKAAQAKYNMFTSIRTESQLEASSKARLRGAIKDNIVTTEEPTTCSSRVLENYVSPFNATVIDLLKDDVQIVGKTNLDEFGMGSGTTNTIFGPTFNPLYPTEKRLCGGSSGGSAAIAATDLVDFALGTDTGGSVRMPGSYTGVFGFKPTYGRLSRWGVIAYAQSLDTVGILGKDIEVVKTVFQKTDKYDPKDPTSLSLETRAQIDSLIEALPKSSKLRIGIPTEFILDNLSESVANGWKEALLKLSEIHTIVPVSIPTMKYALPIYYTIASAEASSNLARYDGVRYGFRSDNDKHNYAKTRSSAFGKVVQNRIILGNFNLNSDSYKNHFLKATLLRSQMIENFNSVFNLARVNTEGSKNKANGVDILLSPTTITKAPTIEEYENLTSTEIYTSDTLTAPVSLAGLPSISVPWKIGNEVPGLQVIGQFGDDNRVLEFAKNLQKLN